MTDGLWVPTSTRPMLMATRHLVSAGHYLPAEAGSRILSQDANPIEAQGGGNCVCINVLQCDLTKHRRGRTDRRPRRRDGPGGDHTDASCSPGPRATTYSRGHIAVPGQPVRSEDEPAAGGRSGPGWPLQLPRVIRPAPLPAWLARVEGRYSQRWSKTCVDRATGQSAQSCTAPPIPALSPTSSVAEPSPPHRKENRQWSESSSSEEASWGPAQPTNWPASAPG